MFVLEKCIAMCFAASLQVGNAVLMSVDGETLDGNLSTSTTAGSLSERDLSYLYDELHKRGLLRAYGSVQMDVVPYT